MLNCINPGAKNTLGNGKKEMNKTQTWGALCAHFINLHVNV